MNMLVAQQLEKVINRRQVLASIDIPVRDINFTFPDEIPKFWFNHNPLLTMPFTALSSAFPEVEW